MCEHPAAPPGYGELFVSQLLSALAANPRVWAKTVFILNYVTERIETVDQSCTLAHPAVPEKSAASAALPERSRDSGRLARCPTART